MKRQDYLQLVTAACALLLTVALLSSCSNSNQLRKCDGRKGIQTPMGLM